MRKVLYVSPHGTNWKVHWQHENTGNIHVLKSDAIKDAKKQVGRLQAGVVSEIRVQKADGTFQTEWTYGKDPFPPAG